MHHSGFHDPVLVALSVLLAIVSSYTALDLFSLARTLSATPRRFWLLAAAVAMGGGIWAMHFVAMLAFSLPGMAFRYDFKLTALSFVLPIAVTGLAFHVVADKTGRAAPLMPSRALMGVGIALMHYTGMAAMRMEGDLHYDAVWVVVSILIAVGAATAALWIASQDTRAASRLGAAVVMGFAIAGMHYSAMQGLVLSPSSAEHAMGGMEMTGVAGWITAVTLLILLLATSAAAFDRRLASRTELEAAKLKASEERFRLLLKSITDYAVFMLDRNGNVANWNTGAQRIKGYSEGEIVGRHFSNFYTLEDRETGLPSRALRLASEEGRFEHEGWRLRKDGTRFWASVVIDPVRDDAGELIGYVKITRDITERKKAQEALEEAREALFQA